MSKLVRATARVALKDRTIRIDIVKHFPTYGRYEAHRFTDALNKTFRVPVKLHTVSVY